MKVNVESLIKDYPTERALDGVSFTLNEKEILCVLGPSGSGKSTLLRCLCGLEKPDQGGIWFNGQPVSKIDCQKEGISVVFDQPLLIDHLSVRENIALGLKALGCNKEQIAERVNELAQEVELTDYLDRKPRSLSAGQKQRVALARALVRDCHLLLLDEALSNLDSTLRRKMIDLLKRLNQRYEFSCLFVTHDQHEAKLLAGRVLILNQGKRLQLDTLQRCRQYPENDQVLQFLEE